MQINCQQHPQGQFEIRKRPPPHLPLDPDIFRSMRRLLLPNISAPVFNFYNLLFSETCTNLARFITSHTGVIAFARFSTRRATIVGIKGEAEVMTF